MPANSSSEFARMSMIWSSRRSLNWWIADGAHPYSSESSRSDLSVRASSRIRRKATTGCESFRLYREGFGRSEADSVAEVPSLFTTSPLPQALQSSEHPVWHLGAVRAHYGPSRFSSVRFCLVIHGAASQLRIENERACGLPALPSCSNHLTAGCKKCRKCRQLLQSLVLHFLHFLH